MNAVPSSYLETFEISFLFEREGRIVGGEMIGLKTSILTHPTLHHTHIELPIYARCKTVSKGNVHHFV